MCDEMTYDILTSLTDEGQMVFERGVEVLILECRIRA